MILAYLIMIIFIIPVFTGQVVNIGNVTGFLCGLFLWYLFRNPAAFQETWVLILLIILIVCILIAVWITVKMIRCFKDKPKGSETLIVLGCEIIGEKPSLMQVERLQAALKYLEQYPETRTVVSGGRGKNEIISEAFAMKEWLLKHGIDKSRIYMEDRSETTKQNLEYSMKIIRENGLNPCCAICSNEFHLYRAMMLGKSVGMKCCALGAPTAWWLLPTFYVRELYAILYHSIRIRLENHTQS